jgi:hypothetical protein
MPLVSINPADLPTPSTYTHVVVAIEVDAVAVIDS